MKKIVLIVFFLATCLLLPISSCNSETDFDPSQYTDTELIEILSKINLYFSKKSIQEGDVLYDDNGVYIEYRGLVQINSNTYYLKIFARNETDKPIELYMNDAFVDRAKLEIANTYERIEQNSLFISTNSYYLKTKVLADYGIDHGKYLECRFTIHIYSGDITDKINLYLSVDLSP